MPEVPEVLFAFWVKEQDLEFRLLGFMTQLCKSLHLGIEEQWHLLRRVVIKIALNNLCRMLGKCI